MLEIKNLSKKFWRGKNEFLAVDNLNLKVKPGSVFGFIGLNGAGKTTTVKLIAGLIFPNTGQTLWKKRPTNDPLTKQKLGFMPEQPQFHRHLSAQEVLIYVGELFGMEAELAEKRAKALIKQVGLAGNAQTPVRDFSKGMSQRLALACALFNDPELLILDEPLDGLDPIGRAEFKRLLLEQKRQGKTVFFSSHILSDIDEICDQVAVINGGRLIFSGTPKTLRKTKKSLEAAFVELVR